MRPHPTDRPHARPPSAGARRKGYAAVRAAGLAGTVALAAAACGGARKSAPPAPKPAQVADASTAPGNTATEKDWQGRPIARAEELFAGRFPGVYVTQAPGGISVRIRGVSTVNGSTDPLFVIDGLPVNAGPGGLVSINPNDIARIEVLKTASQLAEYGVRGGNGVVRITTKRPGK